LGTDPYDGITRLNENRVLILADGLETRARDARQQEMWRSYLSDITFPAQASVVDLGCGTGPISRLLASFPTVETILGLDPSSVLLRRARELAKSETKITYAQGDGMALPLADDSVDVVILHTVLSHVPDPRRVVAEAARVTRIGGWIAAFDTDLPSISVARSDHDPLQAVVNVWIYGAHRNPWLARSLPHMFTGLGLTTTRVRGHIFLDDRGDEYFLSILERGLSASVAAGDVSQPTADALAAEVKARCRNHAFLGQIPYLSVVARKAR